MNTLEMIKDWQESGFKKKYIQTNENSKLPRTVRNNGSNCLFVNEFNITINDPIEYSDRLVISDRELKSEWEEIKEEYSIKEALTKYNNGDTMISLATSRIINKNSMGSKQLMLNEDEINGVWIEKF